VDLGGAGAGLVSATDPRPSIPPLFRGFCDDAAVFPPGSASLPDALEGHAGYRGSWYAGLVGPLVVPAAALPELSSRQASGHPVPQLIVTLPGGPADLPAVLAAGDLPVSGLEIAVPPGVEVASLLATLADVQVPVFVEVPRDARRDEVLGALAGGPHHAKFRTGGVRAALYPDPTELAGSVHAAVAAGVPFKATAGLHHAVRNTDAQTTLDQHGFLNLLVAADLAAAGGTVADLAEVLGERDPLVVADRVQTLDAARARSWFLSFGTCSIHDPLAELIDLALLPAVEEGVRA
jgi:hypothetical protein